MRRLLLVLGSLMLACGDDDAPIDGGATRDSAAPDAEAPDLVVACDDPAALDPHADERASAGSTYTATPTVTAGTVVRWRKSYGPDELGVDTATGEVTWPIPAGLPGETFHVGVVGVDSCGSRVADVWLVTVGDGDVLRVGEGDYATPRAAIADAEPGDTVVIAPGTYDGADLLDSQSDPGVTPPSGTETAFTTLIAAEPGRSIFTGALRVAGKWGPQHHLAFKGLLMRGGVRIEAGAEDDRPHHIKVVDVGSENGLFISRGDDILVEGAYAYGDGRYAMSAYLSERVVIRRSVARTDHAALSGDVSPYGTFIAYSSNDVVFQNVIDIDSDQIDALPASGEPTGAFGVPVTAGDARGIVFERVMSLHNRMKFGSYDGRGDGGDPPRLTYADVRFEDVIGWDIDTYPAISDAVHGFGQGLFVHATFGEIRDGATDDGIALFNGYGGGGILVDEYRDSLFSGIADPLFVDVERLSHLAFHDADPGSLTGAEHQTDTFVSGDERPLRYLLAPESGTFVDGAASDGGVIGATVLTFVGRSGTFFGEPGWDQETDLSMWPFPHEELIAEHMGAYRFDGTLQDGRAVVLEGARGFAARGTALDGGPRTLSSYIWETLGAPCPADRCGR